MFNIKSELSCKGVSLGDNGDLWNFHHNKMLQSGVDADIKEAMNVACTDAYGDLLTLCTILLLTPLVWSLNLNRTKFWKKKNSIYFFISGVWKIEQEFIPWGYSKTFHFCYIILMWPTWEPSLTSYYISKYLFFFLFFLILFLEMYILFQIFYSSIIK